MQTSVITQIRLKKINDNVRNYSRTLLSFNSYAVLEKWISEKFWVFFYDYVIYSKDSYKWSNLELKIKAEGLNLTVVKFWNCWIINVYENIIQSKMDTRVFPDSVGVTLKKTDILFQSSSNLHEKYFSFFQQQAAQIFSSFHGINYDSQISVFMFVLICFKRNETRPWTRTSCTWPTKFFTFFPKSIT